MKAKGGKYGSYLPKLPAEAEEFITQLAVVRRPGTCKTYRQALQRFYLWLQTNSRTLESLSHDDIVAWSHDMMHKHYDPLYQRSMKRNFSATAGLRELHLRDGQAPALRKAAAQLLAIDPAEFVPGSAATAGGR